MGEKGGARAGREKSQFEGTTTMSMKRQKKAASSTRYSLSLLFSRKTSDSFWLVCDINQSTRSRGSYCIQRTLIPTCEKGMSLLPCSSPRLLPLFTNWKGFGRGESKANMLPAMSIQYLSQHFQSDTFILSPKGGKVGLGHVNIAHIF